MPRNVLLIVADDLGSEQLTLTGYGGGAIPKAATPNIDALRDDGVFYSRFYTQTYCSPTRAAYLTGRQGGRTGQGEVIDTDEHRPLMNGEFTLAEAIKAMQLGYTCGLFGKWHLGNAENGGLLSPTFAGFDTACVTMRNLVVNDGTFADPNDWPANESNYRSYYYFDYAVNGEPRVNRGEYASSWTANRALEWIRRQSGSWFCAVNFHAPHSPWHRPPLDTFDTVTWVCPEVQPPNQISPAADIRPYHKAMIESMDHYIGVLLAGISEATLENTTIIFLSDNGSTGAIISGEDYADGALINPQTVKRSVYESGIRCPLVISGAGVTDAGGTDTNLWHAVDLFPTILSICDGGSGRGGRVLALRGTQIDGLSMNDTFEGLTPDDVHDFVMSESFETNVPNAGSVRGFRAAISATHKLIWNNRTVVPRSAGAAQPLFFDLVADPHELVPLAATADQEAYDSLFEKVEAFYADVAEELGE